jgi:ceramide glucosyltransferase
MPVLGSLCACCASDWYHPGVRIPRNWRGLAFNRHQSFRYYSSRPKQSVSASLESGDTPHITIIRPVKGLEPRLYECIASTFQQSYPKGKLTINLCVSEKSDSAYTTLVQIVNDFPGFDARVLVEAEDPLLHGEDGHVNNLGPNPKIRNISRGYREAKGDIIWIIDCNVWVGKGVAGRMVDKLLGLAHDGRMSTPYKFVHQLPLVVDNAVFFRSPNRDKTELLSPNLEAGPSSGLSAEGTYGSWCLTVLNNGGGRLDEMFMATTHAKFYGAINTVGIAPCIVGKSNMFRKSHLDKLTDPKQNPILPQNKQHPVGIDYFSSYICEDHLIGDLLWRSNLPGHFNHGLVFGDLAIQPMAGTSVGAYIARRVRWLRARKWTVLLATLVEPGVESLLCVAYLSYSATTIPWFHTTFGISQTWSAMARTWLCGVSIWMVADWFTFRRLHTGRTVEIDGNTPAFARGMANPGGMPRRSFGEWVLAWIGREVLALPIWTWAVLLGTTLSWRGRTFNVRMDMSVVEIVQSPNLVSPSSSGRMTSDSDSGQPIRKDRLD